MSWSGEPAQGSPKACLITATGHRTELVSNRIYVLGRDADCDLRIEDTGCSRRHARLSVAGDSRIVWVEDLDSKNGTFRNDERIKGKTQLKDNDVLRIGAVCYAVRVTTGALEVELDTRTNVMRKK